MRLYGGRLYHFQVFWIRNQRFDTNIRFLTDRGSHQLFKRGVLTLVFRGSESHSGYKGGFLAVGYWNFCYTKIPVVFDRDCLKTHLTILDLINSVDLYTSKRF